MVSYNANIISHSRFLAITLMHSLACPDTWRTDVSNEDIEHAINSAASGKLRATSVSKVVPLKKLLSGFPIGLKN